MYQHGGDIYGQKVDIDFSINVNPLGMPEGVVKAACRGVEESFRYPDYACRELAEALSRKHGLSKEHLLFGNGAAELIFLLCQAVKPKRALLLAPTFAEYEEALRAAGSEIDYHMLKREEGFALTEEVVERLKAGYDIFFLCNPNNPTGETVESGCLYKILETCRENGTLLVMDECFQEFLEEEEKESLAGKVAEYQNLCILKAFTKIYCMAGLRLGYLITANAKILLGIPRISQPWRVSSPAQYAGVAALKEEEYLLRTKEVIKKERAYLLESLEDLGISCFASKANYIFFQAEEGLKPYLLSKGILIRSCDNYIGLDGTYYRIGIRLHPDNERLVNAVEEFVKERKEKAKWQRS